MFINTFATPQVATKINTAGTSLFLSMLIEKSKDEIYSFVTDKDNFILVGLLEMITPEILDLSILWENEKTNLLNKLVDVYQDVNDLINDDDFLYGNSLPEITFTDRGDLVEYMPCEEAEYLTKIVCILEKFLTLNNVI